MYIEITVSQKNVKPGQIGTIFTFYMFLKIFNKNPSVLISYF